MDFAETRKWIEKKLRENGNDEIVFGSVAVFKDITGQMTIQVGTETFSMDRVPVEVFEKLSAEISAYRSLDADNPESDMTPEQQAIYDSLSIPE